MKLRTFVYPIFILGIVACVDGNPEVPSSAETESIETAPECIDPITLTFFKQDVFGDNMKGKNAVYFLYPGFCGACNDTIVEFIKSNNLPNFDKQYVFSENDSALIKQFRDLGGAVNIFEPDYLMKYGLYKATNHLYLFEDTLLIYESSINAENIEDVRRQVALF